MIGFYMFRSSRPDGRITIDKKALLSETAFVPMVEVSDELELTTTPHPTYVIMPCTYAPAKNGDFRLIVTSESEFQLKEI
eukprot:CAMPEP_0197845926 /NCGR_PEP_ID=MMETSP1438-20131217/2780_1 /TAXON_ID=1461541 /ORGANISM="Pterosperma sp., Strain CCMP1384" /LENGTH=79 /DNA_ID=CAMNT_0043457399 /DNA_START=97 /DNA_END=336 /DNA_ORIENTATION=+